MAAPSLIGAPDRALVFIGFMGAGKTTAARAASQVLGVDAVDLDRELEQRLEKPIEQVFAEDGEAAFRAVEEQAALESLARGGVLSLGGGAVTSEKVRQALREHVVIWIDVELEMAWARSRGSARPLAEDRQRFAELYAERERLYAELADAVVPSERSRELEPTIAALEGVARPIRMLWAASASGDYPVYLGSGAIKLWPPAVHGRRFLVTDGHVGRLYGQELEPTAGQVSIMPGEQSKTVAHAEIVWSELARAGMTREDVVVALGGGVVGDLAGFCAATYQRGVRWVGVPTSLVAQVDSAYGGKTGVDLVEAKNYVGSYHQPAAVLADPDVLATLPPSELAAGYAEVVKTALIAGGWLWESVRTGEDPVDPEILLACARTKLKIVAQDERDGGIRQVLNLGHTVAHAIETSTGYAQYRHGEAVALGLLAALRLSGAEALRAEVSELLSSRGLPVTLERGDPDAVVMATARDKKRTGDGPVPFVLLDQPGRPQPGQPVPTRDLIAAVRELAAK